MSSFADMPAPAHRQLMILQAPASVRAEAIGKLWARPDQRLLAEALMDLEADEVARGAAIEELQAFG